MAAPSKKSYSPTYVYWNQCFSVWKMVGGKSSVHDRPAGPTLSPFHRLTLLMHVSQKHSWWPLVSMVITWECLVFMKKDNGYDCHNQSISQCPLNFLMALEPQLDPWGISAQCCLAAWGPTTVPPGGKASLCQPSCLQGSQGHCCILIGLPLVTYVSLNVTAANLHATSSLKQISYPFCSLPLNIKYIFCM